MSGVSRLAIAASAFNNWVTAAKGSSPGANSGAYSFRRYLPRMMSPTNASSSGPVGGLRGASRGTSVDMSDGTGADADVVAGVVVVVGLAGAAVCCACGAVGGGSDPVGRAGAA